MERKPQNTRELLLALQQDPKYKGKVISESQLRLEVEVANTSVLQFGIGQDVISNVTRNVTEQKLARNDDFYCTGWGLYLKKVVSGAHGKAKVYTYPQPLVFADNSTTFLNEDLEAIYNGKITLKTDSTTQIDGYPSLPFRVAPQGLQAGEKSAAVISSADAITSYSTADEGWSPNQGIVPLNGFLRFEGVKEHELSLYIPDGATLKMAHTAANTANWLVLVMHGVLVKAATK